MKPIIPKDSFLRSIIDHTPAAFLVMDREFNVVFANEFIVNIAGISCEGLIGNKCYEVRGRKQICDKCIVEKAFKSGKKEYRLNEETDIAGNQRFNDNYGVPLYNEDGTFEYVIEIMTDRTEEMKYQRQLAEDFYHILDTFSIFVDAKDKYTGDHSRCVRDLSLLIAERLHLSEIEKRDIYVAASLHDIGKIAVPDLIINKTTKLSEEEYTVIKSHPQRGVELLSKLSSFDNMKNMIKFHHERWDGKGYPSGISGRDIPIGSRIIAVADAYDAMTSNRSYRMGIGHNKAVNELILGSGKQFDPKIVSAFLDVCSMIKKDKENDNSVLEFVEKLGDGDLSFLTNISLNVK